MWFITVVEKMENKCPDWPDNGECRTWGFYRDKEVAIKALHENWTDIREDLYDYAVIEEYEEGICNYMLNRQWFEWNEELGGYYEIDEPDCVKYIACYAIG